MKTSSFHRSNLGAFGENLPSDRDGYVHTTIAGWVDSPRDGLDDSTAEERRDWAREQAKATREAVKLAQKELSNWQRNNC